MFCLLEMSLLKWTAEGFLRTRRRRDRGTRGSVRRQLYQSVCHNRCPVSRDQAADAVGIPYQAKLHLDRLTAEGPTGYQVRAPDRPVRPRRRADHKLSPGRPEHRLSLPQREYELAGRLLPALSATTGEPTVEVLAGVAHDWPSHGRRRHHPTDPAAWVTLDVLRKYVVEPRRPAGPGGDRGRAG